LDSQLGGFGTRVLVGCTYFSVAEIVPLDTGQPTDSPCVITHRIVNLNIMAPLYFLTRTLTHPEHKPLASFPLTSSHSQIS